jgi:hypothetical protein
MGIRLIMTVPCLERFPFDFTDRFRESRHAVSDTGIFTIKETLRI